MTRRFDRVLRTYLFTELPVTEVEAAAERPRRRRLPPRDRSASAACWARKSL